jgi:hypothetical protein
MKKTLFLLALITILLLGTGSAAAKEPRTSFTYTNFICSIDTPEEKWLSGDPTDGRMYHWRDQAARGRFVSTELDWWHGTLQSSFDGVLHYANFGGVGYGLFEKQFANKTVTGTLTGVCTAKIDQGMWSLKCRGDGTGDLAGAKYFVELSQLRKIPSHDPCQAHGARAMIAFAATAELIYTRRGRAV